MASKGPLKPTCAKPFKGNHVNPHKVQEKSKTNTGKDGCSITGCSRWVMRESNDFVMVIELRA
jgi:hypothetical protein